jgi:hypothetical protein
MTPFQLHMLYADSVERKRHYVDQPEDMWQKEALTFHGAKLLILNISGLAENYKRQSEQQVSRPESDSKSMRCANNPSSAKSDITSLLQYVNRLI